MPSYRVSLVREIEQTAEIIVEAQDAEEAETLIQNDIDSGTLKAEWVDGFEFSEEPLIEDVTELEIP